MLIALGRAIGMPFHIDNTISTRDSGYYVMVLIDIDVLTDHPERIRVEVEDIC